MKKRSGFTLIELMIVVAIIAIIAAIAIPSILRSRMSANQTSAVGSLDSILKMNAQFRSNDSDRNGENDYWVENVWGLHAVQSAGGDEIELIPRSVGASDYEANDDAAPSDLTVSSFPGASAKSGYFVAMQIGTDDSGSSSPCGTSYTDDDDSTSSTTVTGNYTNDNRFSVTAFPELYDNTGTKAYLLDESGTSWVVDAKTGVGSSSTQFNGTDDTPNGTEGQTEPLSCRPSDSNLESNWSTTGN